MSEPLNIHLFNCDRTYKLDVVEDWLNRTKAKLGFEFFVAEKHYFSLSEMSELSSKKIPGLRMDLAVFVVHAHESRLSINEDNAGIGYAKIYRALLQATEGNVIIVIGGDDNYKNEDEENREFISRWAKRKISSQFSEEFLDGRKSFIFSWNKKHREIHDEALVHFFGKKGQKFEYQPKRKLPPTPTTPPPARAARPVQPSKPNRSLSEGPSSGERVRSADTTVASRNRPLNDQGAIPKQRSSSVTETTKQPQALAIFGCFVAEDSMQSVRHVFEEVRSKRNISALPPIANRSPAQVKRYLEENVVNICVLVVDAETMKDAYENLPERKVEYENLLETAADRVAERVIILVCDSLPLPLNDEKFVYTTIERVLREKGSITWLKNGELTKDLDGLAQSLTPTSTTAQIMPQRGRPGDFQGPNNVTSVSATETGQLFAGHATERHVVQSTGRETGYGFGNQNRRQSRDAPVVQQPPPSTITSKYTDYSTSTVEAVMLKSKLRFGKIANVSICCSGFQVPYYITQCLLDNYSDISDAEVRIVLDKNSALRWSVDVKSKELSRKEGIHSGYEVLMLHSYVRDGQVSLEERDLRFIYPGWKVPPYVMASIGRDHWAIRYAELFIISNEKGELKYKVRIDFKNRAVGFAKKQWERLREPKK